MKSLIIASKEIIQIARDRKNMVLMVLFPIILIMVLGAALSSQFDSTSIIKDINVAYRIEQGSQLEQGFDSFITAMKKEKIKFKEFNDANKGLDKVKSNNYSCFVNIGKNDIDLYKNDKYQIKAGIIEGMLNNFVQKSSVIRAIRINNPQQMRFYKSKQVAYVDIKSLKKKKKPGSLDYYAVTMITLIILYGSLYGAWSIKDEKLRNTESRVLCTPISKLSLFLGKLMGTFVATFAQICAVVLVSKYILNAYWGNDMVNVMLVLSSLILFSLCFGIGMAFIIKNENIMGSIINAIIPFVSFFGGAYIPINAEKGSFLQTAMELSPIHWTNKSLFQIIYDGSTSIMINALAVNIGLSVVFIAISLILFSRREA